MSKAFSWYYSKNATSSSIFVCWWAKCQISNLQFQGRDCFQLDGSKSKMKTNTCSHHPLTCSYGLADYLQWHQWTPEEPGDHGGQDCTVQEEADGSLSQGAAGLCFTFVTLSSKNVLLSFKRNNEMTSWLITSVHFLRVWMKSLLLSFPVLSFLLQCFLSYLWLLLIRSYCSGRCWSNRRFREKVVMLSK